MTEIRGPAGILAGLSGGRIMALAGLSGVIAGLGQAPFDLWLAMPLGLCALSILVATAQDRRAAMLRAFAGGAGYFALCLHWIVEPFMVDAARFGWMAPFALIFFAGGLALFWAATGWASHALGRTPLARVLVFAPVLTLAEALHNAGYATAIYGKWHLGTRKKTYWPLQNGFDEFYGLPYSNDMIPPRLGRHRIGRRQ